MNIDTAAIIQLIPAIVHNSVFDIEEEEDENICNKTACENIFINERGNKNFQAN